MPKSIVWEAEEVWDELEALGLDYEGLVDSVRYAEQERSFLTANDAVGFASMVVYDKAARGLRETYLGPEWIRDNSNNQCAIRNTGKKLRVVPCNFDENAGDRLRTPTNKAPKGEVSRRKARCNRTLWLPNLPKPEDIDDAEYQTWLLGMHIDGERATTAELSLPIDFDGQYYTDFAKRIILLSGDEDDGPRRRRNNEDPTEETDIPIRRR